MLTPTGATITEYWNAIKSGNPTHVKMEFTGQNVTIEDEDIDVSTGVVVTDILNGDTDLTFGRAVMKEVETRILLTSKTEFLKWTGEFVLSFGVEISGTTNWVTIGTFYGERPKNITTVDAVDFVAYDRMQKFDVLVDGYIDSLTSNDYPISVQGLYEGICTYVGISYAAGDPLANAYARTFNEGDLDLKGYTCRTVLAWIAEACGCYAKITADGKCKLAWFSSNTSYTVTANEEFHIEHADLYDGMIWNEFDALTWDEADMLTWDYVCGYYADTYGVYGVKLKQSNLDFEADYPQAYNENVYVIMDNPFLEISDTLSDLNTYVKPIYDRLSAFGGQLPMKTDCVGNWLVESGDVITIYVMNEQIESPVFFRTLKWNGAINDTYETTGNKKRQLYTESERERTVTTKQIRLFVGDNYYKQQSGIEILPAGVEISGSKYIKMKSGSEIEIQSGGKIEIKSGGSFILASTNLTVAADGTVTATNLALNGGSITLKDNGVTKFSVTNAGYMTAKSGQIAGWNISDTTLTGNKTGLAKTTNDSDIAIWAGNATASSAPFKVTQGGSLTSTDGSIGGWTIGQNSLSNGSGSAHVEINSDSTNDYAIWAGAASTGSAPFKVKRSGEVYLTKLIIQRETDSGSGGTYTTEEVDLTSNTNRLRGGTILGWKEENGTTSLYTTYGTLTFSKATTLSGAWSSGIFTVNASPQGSSISTNLVQGTASWNGNTVTIPVEAIDSDNPGYQYATGRNIALTGVTNGTFSSVTAKPIVSTGGTMYYPAGTAVTKYNAGTTTKTARGDSVTAKPIVSSGGTVYYKSGGTVNQTNQGPYSPVAGPGAFYNANGQFVANGYIYQTGATLYTSGGLVTIIDSDSGIRLGDSTTYYKGNGGDFTVQGTSTTVTPIASASGIRLDSSEALYRKIS